MRAFFVNGYGIDVGLVSFLRRPGSEPQVEWRTPARDGVTAVEPALSGVVPLSGWDALVSEGRLFDRKLAPEGADPLDAICLHSWLARVEVVDPRGRVRRSTQSACGGGLAVPYASKLVSAAIAALPACGVLDPEKSRNDVIRLGECTMLKGDKAAAAEALNAYYTTWFAHPNGPDFAPTLIYMFYDQAELAWPGLPPIKGAAEASRVWTAQVTTSPFYPKRLFGETADRVRMEGEIALRVPGTDASERRVPATIIWTRENGHGFRLRSLSATEAGR